MYRILLPVMTALLMLTLAGTATAQLNTADLTELEERGEQEGWTFTVGENPATQYSLEELCGLVEPEDWRVVGLHHRGGEEMPRIDGTPGTYKANEAIAILALQKATQNI